ncbi:hypothetical protein [Lentisalinibacter salinarum]|uniref:hypothetical protein n=1 Tax=Lentisalinibacter salinarum TaxID=2992239 RepID=UPI003866C5C9
MFRYIFVLFALATAGTVAWLMFETLDSPVENRAPFSIGIEDTPRAAIKDKATALPTSQHAETQPGETTNTTTTGESPARSAWAPGPLALRAHAARAPDFEELLTAYDSVSAATLKEFNARYAGAIAFRTEGEFEWMEDQGFPLPEEILAAADMALADLRTLADGGDPKAQFLYLDRTLQEVRELRQSYLRSGISPDGLKDIPEYGDALIRAAYAKSYLTESDSPFAGYLMAEFSRAAFGNPYGYMAGLLHASHLGDPRAYGKLRAFVSQNDISEDALNAMGAYAVIVEGRGMLRKPE